MKCLIVFLLPLFAVSQVIYNIGPSPYANPSWVSVSNTTPANRVLNYQPNASFISSNDFPAGNRYMNSQITTYTSPVINTTCANATTVNVTMQIGVDLENRYDWAYFQYSLNGGTTWINPVALYPQTNSSGVNLSTLPPLTVSGVGNNRNGWTGNFSGTLNYIIPTSTTTRFRYIFASDGSVSQYNGWFTIYDHYFDVYYFNVSCNVQLPVTLLYFDGYNISNDNVLRWQTESETNNWFFNLEWSLDPYRNDWKTIGKVMSAGNSGNEYVFIHDLFVGDTINYYRLSQVDNDGTITYYDPIAINNRNKVKIISKIFNALGQEVNEDYRGLVFIIYEDGSTEKKILN